MTTELIALFFASLVSSTLFPGGSEVGLAWLANQQDAEVWLLIGVASAGNTLGGIITFVMGYFIANFYPAKRFMAAKHLRAQRWLSQKGSVLLLLSWLPVIGDPLCLLAGWLRLNVFTSLLYIFLGKILRYIVVVYIFA